MSWVSTLPNFSSYSLQFTLVQFQVSMNGIDKIAPKVSVEDSVMVLSKLSLIINNGNLIF